MIQDLEKIPQELKARPQWVLWKSEIRDGKPTKIPYCPQYPKRKAEADNPATWGQFVKAKVVSQENGFAGVGFEFSADDPYTGIDLDKCRDPETGIIKPWAQAIIDRLVSYTEISPSGSGVHILIKGKVPPGGNRKGKVEMYSQARYFTMTGHHLEGTHATIEPRQAELEALHKEVFGKPETQHKAPSSGPGPALELSDRELIDKANQTDAKFSRLWQGDTTGYSSPSEADYALAHKLAFWTNKDPGRIGRLFKQSGLCQDPNRLKKWERLAAQTINKAIANTPEGYNPGKAKQGTQTSPQASDTDRIESEPEKIPWIGHNYFVDRGRLCLEQYDRQGMPRTSYLANFTARITEEITRDDGLRASKEFHITGNLDTGRPFSLDRITAKEFDGLAWIRRELGSAAAVAPGRSLGPHLVNAIMAHSQKAKRRSVFAHSGWRKIGGAWRYLHGGGGVGAGELVEVDLGENLQLYRLPAPGGLEAAQASLRFLDIASWEITAPLIACAYLAPFADLLKIDFSLWIYGPTGSLKSTLAGLALSHYGNFSRLNLPGSWFSTVNSLEKLTFTLKDALCVIDDFIPASTSKEFHTMTEKAGRIIYQAGNRSSRGRLAPDLSARPNYYPRGLILSTGEVLLPGQRQSATARYLGVELDPKKVPIDKARLTAAQSEAHLYAGAMAAYLADLAPRLEDTQAEIKDLWTGYRTAFQSGEHLRIPEIQAWLAVGFEMFLRFQTSMGAITEDQGYEMLNRAWKVFEALGEKHSRIIEGQRPTLKFLAVLRELFLQGRIYAESATVAGAPPPRDFGWDGIEPAHNAELVGWSDGEMLYLMPETALRVVHEAIRRQGDFLSLGRNDMLAALAREGFIEPGKDSQHGRNTHVKKIQGSAKRVICLPVNKLNHDERLEDENL
jgi:hypothetical protein